MKPRSRPACGLLENVAEGTTPLGVASEKGFPDVVKLLVRLLIDAGAGVNKAMGTSTLDAKYSGTTPLTIALYFADEHPGGPEGAHDLVALLLAHGADPAKHTEAGANALDIAKEQHLDDIAALL